MSRLAGQFSARLGRSLTVSVSTAQVNASTQSTGFGPQVYQVRVASPLGLWLAIGDSSVSATAGTDHYLPANTVAFLTVSPGQTLAFLSSSTSTGWVSISELS